MSKRIFLIHFILSAGLLLLIPALCSADAQSQFDTAENFYDQKEYEKAKQHYQAVLDTWPQSEYGMWSQMGLAISELALGNDAAAQAATENLADKFSEDEELALAIFEIANQYYKLQKYEKADQLYQYILDNFSQNPAAMKSQMAVAMSNISLGKADAAQDVIDNLITEFHEDEYIAEVIYRIADQYYRLTDYEKAIELYRVILENWPDSECAIWAQKGTVISNIYLGNEAEAGISLNDLIADFNGNPNLSGALFTIASEYEQAGKYTEADNIRQQISPYASETELDASKSRILSFIADGNDTEAQAAIESLIADFNDHPGLPEMLYWVAGRYENEKKYDKAKGIYQQLIQLYPQSSLVSQAQFDIPRCEILFLIGDGNDSQAQSAFDSFITNFAEHPDLPEVISNIEEGYYRRIVSDENSVNKDYLQPLIMWEKVKTKFPDFFYDDPDLYYFIADCYSHLGCYEKAIEYYGFVATEWNENGYAAVCHVSVSRVDEIAGGFEADEGLIDNLLAKYSSQTGIGGLIFRIGQEYYGRAVWLQRQGLDAEAGKYYLKAIAFWQRIVEQLPASAFRAPACHLSAVSYDKLGIWPGVIDCCQIILTDYPQYEYAQDAEWLMVDHLLDL